MQSLTLTSPTFLQDVLLPALAASAQTSIHGVAVPRARLGNFAEQGLFDVAITLGRPSLPASWPHERVGEVRSALFAAPETARRLGPAPTVDAIRARLFVAPRQLEAAGVVDLEDLCPLGPEERRFGHAVDNIRLAGLLAARTDHLVYGPAIAVAALVAEGELVEIDVAGWDRTDEIRLAADPDAVPVLLFHELTDLARKALRAPPRASGMVSIGAIAASSRVG